MESIDRVFIHSEGNKVIARHIQLPRGFTAAKGNFAKFTGNDAIVTHGRSHKRRKTIVFQSDIALIDNRCSGHSGLVKNHIAFHEIIIGNIACRCNKAVHINLGSIVNDHAGGIYQINIAV